MQKGHVSAIAHSKSTKETQEEAVKHAQSQQYRHQGRATSFTLICCHKSLTLAVPISCPAAVSTFPVQADKCQNSRYLLKSNKIYVSCQVNIPQSNQTCVS